MSDSIRIAINQAECELEKAKAKFPTWPTDPFHAAAIVGEELGELNQALRQFVYEDRSSLEAVRKEAVQVAAMALRFLASVDRYYYGPGDQRHD